MWIVTDKLIFTLYPEDTVEQEAADIKIRRGGTAEEFILKYKTVEEAKNGWRTLMNAFKKNYWSAILSNCEAVRITVKPEKRNLFQK